MEKRIRQTQNINANWHANTEREKLSSEAMIKEI